MCGRRGAADRRRGEGAELGEVVADYFSMVELRVRAIFRNNLSDFGFAAVADDPADTIE